MRLEEERKEGPWVSLSTAWFALRQGPGICLDGTCLLAVGMPPHGNSHGTAPASVRTSAFDARSEARGAIFIVLPEG